MPEKISMRMTMFGDGARGMAVQVARNEEYGVQVEARREKRGAPFIQTFTSDHLPGKTFSSFKELREAFNALSILPPPFKPVVLGVEPKHPQSQGKCWLCRGEWTHTVRVQTGWRDGDQSLVNSCDDDLVEIKADPREAIAARHKWVAEHPPLGRFGA